MATNALNRLEINYYRVDVVGAVDNVNVEQFAADNAGVLPATDVQADNIEFTNMRYEEIIRQVSERIQPLFTGDIVTTSRTVIVPSTAISFTLPYDRPEYLITEDELNNNVLIEDELVALKRMIARALSVDINENRFTFKPSAQVGTTPVGPSMVNMTAPKAFADILTAEGNITVTKIAQLID